MDPALPRLLAFLTLPALLAGCSGGDGGGDGGPDGGDDGGGAVLLQAPADPALGSVWEFRFSGASSGNSTAQVVAREERNGHDAFQLQTNATWGGTQVDTISWVRRGDGAAIESQSHTGTPFGAIATTTTFDPPCAWIAYPVREGASYTRTCTSTTTTGAGAPANTIQSGNVTVLGRESVTVEAGTFDTVHVRTVMEDGSVQDSYYRLDGCGIAKSVTTKAASTSTTELVSGEC